MNFNEAGDKIYVLLSMIERFLVKENCFLRSLEEKNGRQYLPVKMLEFWRLDNIERQLVLRLYHPNNPNPICYFDLKLKNNDFVNKRITKIYELLILGKVEDLKLFKI